jgi:sugar lactone lactonase YvrE
MSRRWAIVLAAAMLAGCGGGGAGSSSGVTPGKSPAGLTQRGTLGLSFATQSSGSSSTRRSPAFVSPAAATAAIAFNGGTATSYDVSSTSSLCSTSNGTRTCQLQVIAPVGPGQSIAVTLMSGGTSPAILGQGSNSFDVVAGTPFSVTVGINPAIGAFGGFGVQFNSGNSFTFGTGPTTATVALTFVDAGGAPITGSGNVPNYLVPVTLVSSDPQHVTFSPSTLTTPGQTFTVTYDGSPAVAIPVTLSAMIGTTTLSTSKLPFSAHLSAPEGLQFDGSGNLWVANATSNQLVVYSSATLAVGANQTNQLIITGAPLNSPRRMAFDPTNPTHLWIASLGGNNGNVPVSVVGFNTATNSVFDTITGSISQPVDVAVDGSGYVYVANTGGTYANTVSVFNPNTSYGLVGSAPVGAIPSGACSGTFSSTSSVLFNSADTNVNSGGAPGGTVSIGTSSTIYTVTAQSFETGVPLCTRTYTSGVNDPTGLAASGNTLYTVEEGANTAATYNLSGTGLTNPFNPPITLPNYGRGVAVDSSGNIYLAITLNNEILEYNSSGTLINTIQ